MRRLKRALGLFYIAPNAIQIIDRSCPHERTYHAYLLFATSLIDKISSCAGNIYGHGFLGYPKGRNVERALGPSYTCVLCISHSLGLYLLHQILWRYALPL